MPRHYALTNINILTHFYILTHTLTPLNYYVFFFFVYTKYKMQGTLQSHQHQTLQHNMPLPLHSILYIFQVINIIIISNTINSNINYYNNTKNISNYNCKITITLLQYIIDVRTKRTKCFYK